jgi:hypothetical protein
MASHILSASRITSYGASDRSLSRALQAAGLVVRQTLCGLNGHDRYLHTEPGRVTLRCVGCGHDSPGWQTGRPAYQLTHSGDPARHRLR